jgi:hypothetical protein
MSSTVTFSMAFARAFSSLRLVRAFTERRMPLIFEMHSSIGLKSGEILTALDLPELEEAEPFHYL